MSQFRITVYHSPIVVTYMPSGVLWRFLCWPTIQSLLLCSLKPFIGWEYATSITFLMSFLFTHTNSFSDSLKLVVHQKTFFWLSVSLRVNPLIYQCSFRTFHFLISTSLISHFLYPDGIFSPIVLMSSVLLEGELLVCPVPFFLSNP